MTYNKSEIMKSAWNMYNKSLASKAVAKRTGITTFASALKLSWENAKLKSQTKVTSTIGWASIRSLASGDTIKVAPPGCASLFKIKTVATIETSGNGFAGIDVTFTDGTVRVFRSFDVVERLAA